MGVEIGAYPHVVVGQLHDNLLIFKPNRRRLVSGQRPSHVGVRFSNGNETAVKRGRLYSATIINQLTNR